MNATYARILNECKSKCHTSNTHNIDYSDESNVLSRPLARKLYCKLCACCFAKYKGKFIQWNEWRKCPAKCPINYFPQSGTRLPNTTAIRKRCYDCSETQSVARNCTAKNCPLWPWRPGTPRRSHYRKPKTA